MTARDRRRFAAALCLLGAGLAGMALYPRMRFGYGWEYSADYFYWLGGESRFAEGYSEAAFVKVKVDMTADEVVRLLGSPLEPGKHDVWVYAAPNDRNPEGWAGHYRVVKFSGGTVKEVTRIFLSWPPHR